MQRFAGASPRFNGCDFAHIIFPLVQVDCSAAAPFDISVLSLQRLIRQNILSCSRPRPHQFQTMKGKHFQTSLCLLLLACVLLQPVHCIARGDRSAGRKLGGFGDSTQVRLNLIPELDMRIDLLSAATSYRTVKSAADFLHLPTLWVQAGRRLTQTTDLAGGLYHIQSELRLETCWNYLSIPNCTVGDTVDLYSQDDGSGRQQFQLVPETNLGTDPVLTMLFCLEQYTCLCGRACVCCLLHFKSANAVRLLLKHIL